MTLYGAEVLQALDSQDAARKPRKSVFGYGPPFNAKSDIEDTEGEASVLHRGQHQGKT